MREELDPLELGGGRGEELNPLDRELDSLDERGARSSRSRARFMRDELKNSSNFFT